MFTASGSRKDVVVGARAWMEASAWVLILGIAQTVMSQGAVAQLVPISQDRSVAAAGTCNSCGSDSQSASAPDFTPFIHSASVNLSNGGSQSFASGSASQSSEILPDGVSGTLSADRSSRNGSSSADSRCGVTFLLGSACSYTMSVVASGAPIPSSASLVGPSGDVFRTSVFRGQTFSSSGVLLPGTYTLTVESAVSGGGASSMSAGAGATFTFSVSELSTPMVLTGPIVNPANCRTYYGLSRAGWAESEAAAIQLGGHLVTINDAAENQWVFNTFSNVGGVGEYLWLGLNNLAHPGTSQFEWTSGEPVGYTNWQTVPPATLSPPQAFGLMYSANTPFPGKWGVSPNDYPNLNIVSGVVEVPRACPCDWDGGGSVDSSDFFAFVTAFFAGSADFDCSGATTSQDFFAFVVCFYAGCE